MEELKYPRLNQNEESESVKIDPIEEENIEICREYIKRTQPEITEDGLEIQASEMARNPDNFPEVFGVESQRTALVSATKALEKLEVVTDEMQLHFRGAFLENGLEKSLSLDKRGILYLLNIFSPKQAKQYRIDSVDTIAKDQYQKSMQILKETIAKSEKNERRAREVYETCTQKIIDNRMEVLSSEARLESLVRIDEGYTKKLKEIESDAKTADTNNDYVAQCGVEKLRVLYEEEKYKKQLEIQELSSKVITASRAVKRRIRPRRRALKAQIFLQSNRLRLESIRTELIDLVDAQQTYLNPAEFKVGVELIKKHSEKLGDLERVLLDFEGTADQVDLSTNAIYGGRMQGSEQITDTRVEAHGYSIRLLKQARREAKEVRRILL